MRPVPLDRRMSREEEGRLDAAGYAVAGGLLGGLAFLAVVYLGLASGMTEMNFLRVPGAMMAPNATTRTAYSLGLVVDMMASAAFGLAHGAIIDALGLS